MGPIAPPPTHVINDLANLLAAFRNLDQVEALVKDLQHANAKQQELLKAQGFLDRVKEMEAGTQSEIQALKIRAEQELAEAQAIKAEAETLRQEMLSQRIAAGDRMREAETKLAEAEAIKVDASNARKKLLAMAAGAAEA